MLLGSRLVDISHRLCGRPAAPRPQICNAISNSFQLARRRFELARGDIEGFLARGGLCLRGLNCGFCLSLTVLVTLRRCFSHLRLLSAFLRTKVIQSLNDCYSERLVDTVTGLLPEERLGKTPRYCSDNTSISLQWIWSASPSRHC